MCLCAPPHHRLLSSRVQLAFPKASAGVYVKSTCELSIRLSRNQSVRWNFSYFIFTLESTEPSSIENATTFSPEIVYSLSPIITALAATSPTVCVS